MTMREKQRLAPGHMTGAKSIVANVIDKQTTMFRSIWLQMYVCGFDFEKNLW